MAEAGRATRVALAGVVAAAVMALAATGRPMIRLLLVPVVLSFIWSPPPLGAAASRILTGATRLMLAGAIVLGFVITAYPVVPEQTLARLTLLTGWLLAALAVAELLAAPTGARVLPPAMGALAVASFDPQASIRGWHLAAVVAAIVYAASVDRTFLPAGSRARARWPALAAFAAVVLLVAWGITRLLPWAQPQVEQTAASLLTTSDRSYSGLSDRSSLGDIESLSLSRTVVLRLWADRPLKLRGRVFTDFDGKTWSAPVVHRPPLPVAGIPADPGDREWLERARGTSYGVAPTAGSLRARMALEVAPHGLLLAPAHTAVVRQEDSGPLRDTFGILFPTGMPPQAYATLSAASGDSGPDATIERCLVLPRDTDARILSLAAEIGAGARDPADRVRRTSEWLDRECRYTLAVGRFHSKQPVAEFLFEKKRGYCEYFASAAALLLRAQGVPTRYVAGFSPSEDQYGAGHYAVREADAHAWIEAWIPGRGWVEADPTPAADFAAVREPLSDSVWEALAEWGRAWLAQARIHGLEAVLAWLRGGGWRVALAAAVALVAAWSAWKNRRRLGWRRSALTAGRTAVTDDVPPELAHLLARVDRHWAAAGAERPGSRAPLEHLLQVYQVGSPASSRLSPEALAAARVVVERYYRARFGGEAVRPDEHQALSSGLSAAGIR